MEDKESKILNLNREIFLRNSINNNEDFDDKKETNCLTKSNIKKRYSYNSNIINSVFKSDINNKSILGIKRKFGEINSNNKFETLNLDNLENNNFIANNNNQENGLSQNDYDNGNNINYPFDSKRKKMNGQEYNY